MMIDFRSNKAKKIKPYAAGAQPKIENIIKLNTNENPYPPSPRTIKVLKDYNTKALRLYPPTDGGELRNTIAALYGFDESFVFCSNGSDEVLGFAFNAFFDKNIVFPDITYSFYSVWADFFNVSYKTLPLSEEFTMPIENFKAEGVVFPNPNAPTGIAIELIEIETILNQNPNNVVIIDEAYATFGTQSALPLINKYPNLLVVRTLSKSHSLAGIRIGYAIGQPHLIAALDTIKYSFNSYTIDSLSQAVAIAALNDTKYYEKTTGKICATRERISIELKKIGFNILPSSANFIFVSNKDVNAKEINRFLETRKIFVRHFDLPRISNFIRISIGTDKQMDTLLISLKEIISKR